MTADEILKELENIPSVQAEENDGETQYCEIDPETREIYVPDQYAVIGVESDEKSNRIYFHCPKIVGDNIDLSALQLRVNFRNAIGDDTINAKDQYIVDDVETDGDYITFSWLLSRKVTKYKGEIDFIVCAVRVSGETITNEWNTTLAHSEVLEGLEVTVPQPSEEESDVIAQLLDIMETSVGNASRYENNAQQWSDTATAAAAQAKSYMEQTKRLSITNVGNITFGIDPIRNCLTATYNEEG